MSRAELPDFNTRLKSHLLGASLSLRQIAEKAGVSVATLSLFLNDKLPLSEKMSARVLESLNLDEAELSYLHLLREWKCGSTPEIQLQALKKLYRIPAFRKAYRSQIETSNYLTSWLYVAIRELATIPGFQLNENWIRQRLTFRATTPAVKAALKFLIEKGFIVQNSDGNVSVPERDLTCEKDLYLFSMGFYHRSMLDLAKQSLLMQESSSRFIDGMTLSLPKDAVAQLRKEWTALADKAVQLSKEAQNNPQQDVYQIEFTMFPLTKTNPSIIGENEK